MRLLAEWEGDALGGEFVVFGVLEVDGRGSAIHVAVGSEVEVAQLGAEHGEHDILEVGVGAIGALEWGSDEAARR